MGYCEDSCDDNDGYKANGSSDGDDDNNDDWPCTEFQQWLD